MKKKVQKNIMKKDTESLIKRGSDVMNIVISLAELSEQIESLDLKIDRYKGYIMSELDSQGLTKGVTVVGVRECIQGIEDLHNDVCEVKNNLNEAINEQKKSIILTNVRECRQGVEGLQNESWELRKYVSEIKENQKSINQKMKISFITNVTAVALFLMAICINLFAGENITARHYQDENKSQAESICPRKDTIYLSDKNTTHIRFDSDIKYVDLSNKVIMAKIVEGSKDIVAVRAREPFDFSTSISCLESDGDMHSYIVVYDENPANLIIDSRHLSKMEEYVRQVDMTPELFTERNEDRQFDIEDMKYARQEFYHIGSQRYDIHCFCKNIFVDKDVYYFVFDLKNFSKTSYELSEPRFAIESRKRSSRGLKYEKQLYPRVVSACNKIEPRSSGKMVFAFEKFSVPRDQVFNVYVYEKDGTRNFRISILGRDIKDATMLKDLGCKKVDWL